MIFRKLLEKIFYLFHPFPKNPYNPYCWIIGNPKIGKNCWIGPFTVIDGSGGLEIGDETTISSSVHIYTHSAVRRNISRGKYRIDRKPVKIGNFVHIGPNSTILTGVTIGDYTVVGAGSVILEDMDIPPHSIVVGVPAKVIGKRSQSLLSR